MSFCYSQCLKSSTSTPELPGAPRDRPPATVPAARPDCHAAVPIELLPKHLMGHYMHSSASQASSTPGRAAGQLLPCTHSPEANIIRHSIEAFWSRAHHRRGCAQPLLQSQLLFALQRTQVPPKQQRPLAWGATPPRAARVGGSFQPVHLRAALYHINDAISIETKKAIASSEAALNYGMGSNKTGAKPLSQLCC